MGRGLTLNYVFADIGELGWSLYLSAHIKYLRYLEICHNMDLTVVVITYKDRFCLYEKIVDELKAVPLTFTKRFGKYSREGFGLYGVKEQDIRDFVLHKFTAKGFIIPEYFRFECEHLPLSQMIFSPYDRTKKCSKVKKIIILPRYRKTYRTKDVVDLHGEKDYSIRNIPRDFYEELARELLLRFPYLKVYAVGRLPESYVLEGVQHKNFVNKVSENISLQDLIDLCYGARLAVGGTSAPPKITLLQNVPTFVIGHERKRFVEEENWLLTPIDFYDIGEGNYQTFDYVDCIDAVVEFGRSII